MKRQVRHLSDQEALQLHQEALVIDSKQPPATSGFLFTERMKLDLLDMDKAGYTRAQASNQLSKIAMDEIRDSESAREQYLSLWHRSGVSVASGTYSAGIEIEKAFESATEGIAQARGYIDALQGELQLILKAEDIETVYSSGKHGLILCLLYTSPSPRD